MRHVTPAFIRPPVSAETRHIDCTLGVIFRHWLNPVAGAERAGEEAGGAAALLSPAAEEALRAAVYEGAAFSSHKGGPAEVLMGHLQQPFLDLRVAAYRLGSIVADMVMPMQL